MKLFTSNQYAIKMNAFIYFHPQKYKIIHFQSIT